MYLICEAITCNDTLKERIKLKYIEWRTTLKYEIQHTLGHSEKDSEALSFLIISIVDGLIAQSLLKTEEIDFESISSSSITSNSILLTHHALISSDKNDHAAMRGGYDLIKILETNNVIALLHGHTHGCKRYSVGHDCQIIGVGPMFKQIDDISNQCNLIHIKGNYVKRILTLTYHDDRKIWDKVEIYEKNADNNYYGDSVGKIYDQVLHDAKANLLLPNLRIQIKQEYSKFENEIKQRFSACMEDAKAWQSSECPDNLEYTHGQLMNHGGIKWEQHIVDTLVKNPTSKRAVIPLIDKDMVYKGGDDRLVSFDVVQFGFSDSDSKDLYITLYMRALEIKHFLPLNLC
jgi:hypothetical protein